jgi:hypothetical protein
VLLRCSVLLLAVRSRQCGLSLLRDTPGCPCYVTLSAMRRTVSHDRPLASSVALHTHYPPSFPIAQGSKSANHIGNKTPAKGKRKQKNTLTETK